MHLRDGPVSNEIDLSPGPARFHAMNKMNTNELAELTWTSPKDTFAASGRKEVSGVTSRHFTKEVSGVTSRHFTIPRESY
jgi:hypothetical protein